MDYIHKRSGKPAQAIKVDLKNDYHVKEALAFIGHISNVNYKPKDSVSSERFYDYISDIMLCGKIINVTSFDTTNATVEHGDYIIRTERGKFLPCKAYIFEEQYELSLQLNIK